MKINFRGNLVDDFTDDLTEIFHTPDELADYCLLEPHEQDKLLEDMARAGLIPTKGSCPLRSASRADTPGKAFTLRENGESSISA